MNEPDCRSKWPCIVYTGQSDSVRLPISEWAAGTLVARQLHLAGRHDRFSFPQLVSDPTVVWLMLIAWLNRNADGGHPSEVGFANWLQTSGSLSSIDWSEGVSIVDDSVDFAMIDRMRTVAGNVCQSLNPDSGNLGNSPRLLSCLGEWLGLFSGVVDVTKWLPRGEILTGDGQSVDVHVGEDTDRGMAAANAEVPTPVQAAWPRETGAWSETLLALATLPNFHVSPDDCVDNGRQTPRRDWQAVALDTRHLAAMKELAYGASHEINNPLANIATRAQTLLMAEADPQRRRTLATINEQAFRAHEMIADLMLFAKPPEIEANDVRLHELLAELSSSIDELAQERQVEIRFPRGRSDVFVCVDRPQMLVALRAICVNACEAIQDGGQIEITFRIVPDLSEENERPGALSSAESASVEICLRDSGPGIPEDILPYIFDPFYSGREAGRGLGFGLSRAWRIIHDHGGQLEVGVPSIEVSDREHGENDDMAFDGANFRVQLPCQLVGPLP